ncbi:hypothetical protein AAH235_000225 [Providencia stuartii]|nr:hypothetical protein BGK56_05535 [Providencia stuartii]AVL39827.1 hypothetical protein CEP70_07390 [Providencia stuartii]MBG5895189.1 hypothetical protein [Providencia stuartii]MBG5902589.1 hypothetical protein [Providencia stuartii]MBG5910432.1 hypothetical protein [Providencia stuartii]
MKKIFSLIVMLCALFCITSVSMAGENETAEKKTKIDVFPQPYSTSDLYGYWFDTNNTPEVRILKLMILAPNGVARDALLIELGDNVEEIKQESLWKFDPNSSVLTQEVTKMTYTINGKIEPIDFGEVEPVKVSVTIKKRGDDIFMNTVSDDGTVETYQKITKEMKDKIHQKAKENARK